MLFSLTILLIATGALAAYHPPYNVTDPPPKNGFLTALDGLSACQARCFIAESHHTNLWWSSVPHFCHHKYQALGFHYQKCHVKSCVEVWNFTNNNAWIHSLCRSKTHQYLWPEDGNGTEADIHPEDKIMHVKGQGVGIGHWEKAGAWWQWIGQGKTGGGGR